MHVIPCTSGAVTVTSRPLSATRAAARPRSGGDRPRQRHGGREGDDDGASWPPALERIGAERQRRLHRASVRHSRGRNAGGQA